MTNGRGDRTRGTPYRHRGVDHVGMIGARASRTSSRPAATQRPHKQAVYMTAPETPVVTPSKPLANRGPSIHDGLMCSAGMTPLLRARCMVSDPQGLTPGDSSSAHSGRIA